MPDIASVLKQEIGRLARKESRALFDPLRKSVAVQRREIAALKRELESLRREVKRLRKNVGTPATSPAPTPETQRPIRFSPASLKKHREKVGLSQQEYGTLLGVTSNTIWNWENGNAVPRLRQRERIAEVRSLGKRAAREALER